MRHMATHCLGKAGHHRLKIYNEDVFHAGQRFDQAAAEKSRKAAASLGGIGGQFKERPGHDIDDLIQTHKLSCSLLFRLGQRL